MGAFDFDVPTIVEIGVIVMRADVRAAATAAKSTQTVTGALNPVEPRSVKSAELVLSAHTESARSLFLERPRAVAGRNTMLKQNISRVIYSGVRQRMPITPRVISRSCWLRPKLGPAGIRKPVDVSAYVRAPLNPAR